MNKLCFFSLLLLFNLGKENILCLDYLLLLKSLSWGRVEGRTYLRMLIKSYHQVAQADLLFILKPPDRR